MTPPSKAPPFHWSWLIFAALVHRLILVLATSVLATDSAFYLTAARGWLEGDLNQGMLLGFHPLYAILTAAIGGLLGNLVTAGYLISVLCGALIVVPLHRLVRSVADESVAWWSGLLYAAHPVLALETSEVMSTSVFLLSFLSAVTLFQMAASEDRFSLFLLSGLAAGFAYYARPEGILFLPFAATAFVVFLVIIIRRRRPADLRRTLGSAAGLALLVLLMLPMIFWIHAETGRWFLSPRSTVQESWENVTGGDGTTGDVHLERPVLDDEEGSRRRSTMVAVWKYSLKALYVPLLLFLVIGWIVAHRRNVPWARSWPLLLTALAVPGPVTLAYMVSPNQAMSHRYFLVSVCLMLPWVAAGFLFTARWIAGRIPRWPRERVIALCAAALVVGMLAKSVRPRRSHQTTIRAAGDWLRKRGGEKRLLIFSTRPVAGIYGECDLLWKIEPGEDIRDVCRERKVDYVVLDENSVKNYDPTFIRTMEESGYVREAEFPEPETPGRLRVWIYRVPR